ncbi:MAG: hypothetical protein HUJ75_07590 [Parasporobacterium sp.]|nr:hypothetical protein [Parasporobacterium sp.]
MNPSKRKIIIDICGADASPATLAKGAFSCLSDNDEFDIILAGPEEIIRNTEGFNPDRVEIIDTEDFVTNSTNPATMLTEHRSSSMMKALDALKHREDIAALVSAGSTGCLLVGSIFGLGLMGKLKQPALASLLPAEGGLMCLVDCGSNLNPKASDLADYAVLGTACMKAYGFDNPPVGIINVGAEPGKGTALVKEASELLSSKEGINFAGNVEGSDILSGRVRVAVTDGFTGNVLLKAMEACGRKASDIAGGNKDILGFFAYNSMAGAVFLGTSEIVIKAHGSATEETIKACIGQAAALYKGGFTDKLKAGLK